jgi:hypothetical protein
MTPGWFPDPHRRYELRYYNGLRWTADVSVHGQRYVDPRGAEATAIPPRIAPAEPGPTPTAPGSVPPLPRSSAALASMVLGIVAISLAWLPFLVVIGAILALIALPLAVVGRRQTRRGRSGAGLATAGLVLAPTALVLCVVGVLLSRQVLDLVDVGPYEVTEESCTSAEGVATFEGTLTNGSDDTRSYVVTVAFVRTGDGRVVGSDRVELTDVPAGAVVAWTATDRTTSESIECDVRDVSGPLPFGT